MASDPLSSDVSEIASPAEGEPQGVIINPFAFAANQASRIRGLGGPDAPSDPSYAFHTPYVFCTPGEVTFALRFRGLRATTGNLTIRVHAMSTAPGSGARSIKMMSKPLADIADGHSDATISIKAKPDTLYAIVGLIYGPCDAEATAFSIHLDRPDDGSAFEEGLERAKFTVFGRGDITIGTTQLISPDPANLAYPVSQMCTASQFEEPVYDQWVAAMGARKHRHRKQWEFVYILQALSVYGMLQPGAQGLGFGVGGEPLPAVLAARGSATVATGLSADDDRSADWNASGQHLRDLDAMRRPDLCANDRFDEAVSFRPVDMTNIPADLRDFDFCWSACALEHLGSIRAGLEFIANSVRCLKIGGIAIHTTELNLTSGSETIDNEATVLFRRMDFERLAMDMIAEGHSVTQFKYDQGNKPIDRYVDLPPYRDDDHLKMALGRFVTTSFGIIIQRGEPI